MKFFTLLFVLFFIFRTMDAFSFRSLSNTKFISLERSVVHKQGLCKQFDKKTFPKVSVRTSFDRGLFRTGDFMTYLVVSPILLVGCIPIQLIIFLFQTIGMIMFDNDE